MPAGGWAFRGRALRLGSFTWSQGCWRALECGTASGTYAGAAVIHCKGFVSGALCFGLLSAALLLGRGGIHDRLQRMCSAGIESSARQAFIEQGTGMKCGHESGSRTRLLSAQWQAGHM